MEGVLCRHLDGEEGGGPVLTGEVLLCGDIFMRKPTFCDECYFLFFNSHPAFEHRGES